ncbi:MAG: hypothetical protein V7L11_05125 [Nostoc sp.]|uniref:hypothetical protein n=1 Tax=Nostoc sp. TaxID=1180 RepID=UPI002FFCDFE3
MSTAPISATLAQSERDAVLQAMSTTSRFSTRGYATIKDILDLSKIEAGKMILNLETFDIAALINNIIPIIKPMIEKNGNILEKLPVQN